MIYQKNDRGGYKSPQMELLWVEVQNIVLAASWSDGSIDDNNWNNLGEYM